MKFQSKLNPLLTSILAIGLLCAATATSAADAVKPDTAFSEAMAHYKAGKWPGAYGRFAALADHGNAEAARIALIMLRHGAQMYGSAWGASQPQIEQWTKLAFERMGPLQSVSGE